jgi:cell division protein FtsZ
MQDAGTALMGIGYGTGDSRASEAARAAVDSPLLEMSIHGAQGILFNITGGNDLSMFEVDEAARIITEAAAPEANIIFGAVLDERMKGDVKITVIATGFDRQPQVATAMTDVPMATISIPRVTQAVPSTPDLEIPAFLRRAIGK